MSDATPQRRTSDARIGEIDKRLSLLEQRVHQSLDEQRAMRAILEAIREDMAEPQSSPLGRALLERSITNATEIRTRGAQVDSLMLWQNQMIGAYRGTKVLQTVLAIVVAILGLAQAVLLLRP